VSATIVDITGKTFGRVNVLGCIGVNPLKKDRRLHWICVCRNKQGKWEARIHVEGKPMHLGTYETFEEACAAREEAELKCYGFTKE